MAKRRKYKILDIVRRWYMGLGILICLIGTIAAGLMIYNSGGAAFGLLVGCAYFIGAMVAGISLAATGEAIELAMDTEENTRQSADKLASALLLVDQLNEDVQATRASAHQCNAWLAKIGKTGIPVPAKGTVAESNA